MKKITMILAVALTVQASAQIAINETGNPADPSAVLDISSDTRGFLMPRMNQAARTALSASAPMPAVGTMVYQTDGESGFYYFGGATDGWKLLNGGSSEALRATVTLNPGLPATGVGMAPSSTMIPANGWTYADAGNGKMTVNHPSLVPFGATSALAEPTIIVTAEYNPNGAPPLPDDYCPNAFSNNCGNSGAGATHQYLVTVATFKPAGALQAMDPFTAMMGICPTPASCNTADDTDHQEHLLGGAGPLCPGYGGFGVGSDGYQSNALNRTVSAVEDFDIFIRANNVTTGGAANASSVSIFIDWNQDGDFDDLDETVLQTPKKPWGNAAAVYAGANQNVYPIDVPAHAANGRTTMRIVTTNIPGTNVGSCITNNAGSTRDFQLDISSAIAPVFPGQARVCNVKPTTPYTNQFQVNCYDPDGSFIYNKLSIVVKPN